MSTAKQTLKHHLQTRVNYLVNDSRTFLWAKLVHRETFEKQQGIGGGNFLIVIGDFACLDLLSKIYWILSKDPNEYPFIDKNAQKEFKKQAEKIKEEVDKNNFDLFFKYCTQGLRVGFQINEKEAFVNLISALYRDGIDLGLKDDRRMIEKVWNDLRTSFSHYAVPGSGNVAAFIGDAKGQAFGEIIENIAGIQTPPFIIEQSGEVTTISDLLNQYLEHINKWISNKIDVASEKQVAACLKEIKLFSI